MVIRVGLPQWGAQLRAGSVPVQQLTRNIADILRGAKPQIRTFQMILAADTATGPEAVRAIGIVIAAALAADRDPRARRPPRARWAMLGALALTPVLLILSIWESPQLDVVHDHPLPALGGGAGRAAIVVGPLAVLFSRQPAFLPLAALAALPFRVPVEAGGSTANLLVPLYLVIAGAARSPGRSRACATATPSTRRAQNGAMEWLLAGSMLLYALQAAYSTSLDKALEQTVFFYVPFALLFWSCATSSGRRSGCRPASTCWSGWRWCSSAIGFVEYATRSLLLNPKVIASNELEAYFRVNSLFFDPNIYGRFLALVMLGLAGVLLWERRPRDGRGWPRRRSSCCGAACC